MNTKDKARAQKVLAWIAAGGRFTPDWPPGFVPQAAAPVRPQWSTQQTEAMRASRLKWVQGW